MATATYEVGVGMTKLEKPGSHDLDYPDMAREAGLAALADPLIRYDLVEEAFIGYCYGDSTSGQGPRTRTWWNSTAASAPTS